MSEVTFRNLVQAGYFAEWAEVYGNKYGTTHSAITRAMSGTGVAFLVADIQGAKRWISKETEALQVETVFITAPVADFSSRMEHRLDLDLRDTARLRELLFWHQCDYCIINSGTIEEAVQEVIGLLGL